MRTDLTLRPTTQSDLPAIVALLADDDFGTARERPETPLPDAYTQAFAAIGRQPGNTVIVAEQDAVIIACLQLIIIPGLSHLGMTRAEIEAVRVASAMRGRGIGSALLRHAIELARASGCGLVQLTTNSRRHDAQRFYQRLGFTPSHVGMKLLLSR